MNKVVVLLGIIFILNCQQKQVKSFYNEFQLVDTVSKLEKLLSLPQDSIYEYYDLSDELLTEQPDLSCYTIRSLNFSHNNLDTLLPSFLPKGLESLDLSYNFFTIFHYDSINRVKELILSHNYLRRFSLVFYINRIDLSYNDLYFVRLYWTYENDYKYHFEYRGSQEHGKMDYLNISHNPKLKHMVNFEPNKIDTIIRNNIADEQRLIEIKKYVRWK